MSFNVFRSTRYQKKMSSNTADVDSSDQDNPKLDFSETTPTNPSGPSETPITTSGSSRLRRTDQDEGSRLDRALSGSRSEDRTISSTTRDKHDNGDGSGPSRPSDINPPREGGKQKSEKKGFKERRSDDRANTLSTDNTAAATTAVPVTSFSAENIEAFFSTPAGKSLIANQVRLGNDNFAVPAPPPKSRGGANPRGGQGGNFNRSDFHRGGGRGDGRRGGTYTAGSNRGGSYHERGNEGHLPRSNREGNQRDFNRGQLSSYNASYNYNTGGKTRGEFFPNSSPGPHVNNDSDNFSDTTRVYDTTNTSGSKRPFKGGEFSDPSDSTSSENYTSNPHKHHRGARGSGKGFDISRSSSLSERSSAGPVTNTPVFDSTTRTPEDMVTEEQVMTLIRSSFQSLVAAELDPKMDLTNNSHKTLLDDYKATCKTVAVLEADVATLKTTVEQQKLVINELRTMNVTLSNLKDEVFKLPASLMTRVDRNISTAITQHTTSSTTHINYDKLSVMELEDKVADKVRPLLNDIVSAALERSLEYSKPSVHHESGRNEYTFTVQALTEGVRNMDSLIEYSQHRYPPQVNMTFMRELRKSKDFWTTNMFDIVHFEEGLRFVYPVILEIRVKQQPNAEYFVFWVDAEVLDEDSCTLEHYDVNYFDYVFRNCTDQDEQCPLLLNSRSNKFSSAVEWFETNVRTRPFAYVLSKTQEQNKIFYNQYDAYFTAENGNKMSENYSYHLENEHIPNLVFVPGKTSDDNINMLLNTNKAQLVKTENAVVLDLERINLENKEALRDMHSQNLQLLQEVQTLKSKNDLLVKNTSTASLDTPIDLKIRGLHISDLPLTTNSTLSAYVDDKTHIMSMGSFSSLAQGESGADSTPPVVHTTVNIKEEGVQKNTSSTPNIHPVPIWPSVQTHVSTGISADKVADTASTSTSSKITTNTNTAAVVYASTSNLNHYTGESPVTSWETTTKGSIYTHNMVGVKFYSDEGIEIDLGTCIKSAQNLGVPIIGPNAPKSDNAGAGKGVKDSYIANTTLSMQLPAEDARIYACLSKWLISAAVQILPGYTPNMEITHVQGKIIVSTLLHNGFAKTKGGETHPAIQFIKDLNISPGDTLAYNYIVACMFAQYHTQRQQSKLATVFYADRQFKNEATADYFRRMLWTVEGLCVPESYIEYAQHIRDGMLNSPGKQFLCMETIRANEFTTFESLKNRLLRVWLTKVNTAEQAGVRPNPNPTPKESVKDYPPKNGAQDKYKNQRGAPLEQKAQDGRQPQIKGQCLTCGPNVLSRHTTENHRDGYVARNKNENSTSTTSNSQTPSASNTGGNENKWQTVPGNGPPRNANAAPYNLSKKEGVPSSPQRKAGEYKDSSRA
jgi:hypothetical protein